MSELYELNPTQVDKLVKLVGVNYPEARVFCSGGAEPRFKVIKYVNTEAGELGIEDVELGDLATYVSAHEAVLDDVAAQEARAKRAVLLAECDWSQLPDVKQELREAYAGYRQALRDIPDQAGFPHEIEWPEVPSTDAAKLLAKP